MKNADHNFKSLPLAYFVLKILQKLPKINFPSKENQ